MKEKAGCRKKSIKGKEAQLTGIVEHLSNLEGPPRLSHREKQVARLLQPGVVLVCLNTELLTLL